MFHVLNIKMLFESVFMGVAMGRKEMVLATFNSTT